MFANANRVLNLGTPPPSSPCTLNPGQCRDLKTLGKRVSFPNKALSSQATAQRALCNVSHQHAWLANESPTAFPSVFLKRETVPLNNLLFEPCHTLQCVFRLSNFIPCLPVAEPAEATQQAGLLSGCVLLRATC